MHACAHLDDIVGSIVNLHLNRVACTQAHTIYIYTHVDPAPQWMDPAPQWMDPATQWMDPAPQWMDPAPQWMDPATQWMDPATKWMDPATKWMDPATQCGSGLLPNTPPLIHLP